MPAQQESTAETSRAALGAAKGPEFLVQREVAALLRASERTLERWRLEGVGPKWRRIGRKKVIYAREDVMAYADSRTFTSTAEANAADDSGPAPAENSENQTA